jgi:hypothetical protein
VHQLDIRGDSLICLSQSISHAQLESIFVQPEIADAPAVVLIAGDLKLAVARRGADGHRRLLIRAGAAGHRAWMAAIGLDLQGCLIAGVNSVPAKSILQGMGCNRDVLFALALGHGRETFKEMFTVETDKAN